MNENELESELRLVLRREEAPPDFAARVRALTVHAAPEQRVVVIPVWRRPAAWALAAGLAVAAIVPPAVSEYQRRREARALEAKRELLIALSVTRAKLQHARDRIQRTTRPAL
jgi:hypothetical protein